MKKFMPFCLMILTLFNTPINAQEVNDVHLASEEWAHATNADGTGLYWDIFRAVYEPEGISLKIMIRSYSGSVELVKRRKVDGVVAAYAGEIDEAFYPENHFAVDVVQALFKKDRIDKWEGQASLNKKKVGWIEGYALDEYLEVAIEKMEFADREGALKALEKGRYDFFLDAQGDLLEILNTGIVETEKYRRETIKQLPLFVAFSKNEKGKKLVEIFDRKFPELLESGTIKALYEKWRKGGFTYPFDR